MMEQLFQSPTGAVERRAEGRLPVLFETTSRSTCARRDRVRQGAQAQGRDPRRVLAGELAETQGRQLDVIVPALASERNDARSRRFINLQKPACASLRPRFPWNNPAGLRLSARCAYARSRSEAAWNALTSDAARIAGSPTTSGASSAGSTRHRAVERRSLDLGSHVVAVYVGGVQVAEGNDDETHREDRRCDTRRACMAGSTTTTPKQQATPRVVVGALVLGTSLAPASPARSKTQRSPSRSLGHLRRHVFTGAGDNFTAAWSRSPTQARDRLAQPRSSDQGREVCTASP